MNWCKILVCTLLLPLPTLAAPGEDWIKAWSAADSQGDQGAWPSSLDLVVVSYLHRGDRLAVDLEFGGAESARAAYDIGFEAEGRAHAFTCRSGPGVALGDPPARCYATATDASGTRVAYAEQPVIVRSAPNILRIVFDRAEIGAATESLIISPSGVMVTPTLAVTMPTYSETNLARADEHDFDAAPFELPAEIPALAEAVEPAPQGGAEAPAALAPILAFLLLAAAHRKRRGPPN